jgi:hypothetical protein
MKKFILIVVMAVFSQMAVASGSLTMGYQDLSNKLELRHNNTDDYTLQADARMVVLSLDVYGDIGDSNWIYVLSGEGSISSDGISNNFDEADWYSAGLGLGYKVGDETTVIGKLLVENSEFTGESHSYDEDVQSVEIMFWRELISSRGWGAKVGVGGHISLSDSQSNINGNHFAVETKTSGAIFEASGTYQTDILKFEFGYRFRNYAAIGSDTVSSNNLVGDVTKEDFTGYDHGLYAGVVAHF